MGEPFRSDLDAARARVDVLAEENDELREEVVRLRQARRETPNAVAEDPAIAKLSEETLERLDEMTDAIEAIDVPSAEPLEPMPSLHLRPADQPPVDHAAHLEVAHLRTELGRAEAERDLARAARTAIPAWALFAVGLVLGLVIGVALGSVR
jgi:regulator of replication initiation timing